MIDSESRANSAQHISDTSSAVVGTAVVAGCVGVDCVVVAGCVGSGAGTSLGASIGADVGASLSRNGGRFLTGTNCMVWGAGED